jgi:hydrogenase maturation protease
LNFLSISILVLDKNSINTLLLGIGNDILTDDAIGPKLVKRLETNLKGGGLSFHTAAVGGMEIIEFISGYQKVIIIDAIRTKEGIPGTVSHFTPADFKETLHLSSFHDMNFLTALEFAKKLNLQLPGQIDIIAIEIVEDLTFSNEFSPIIAEKFDQIYNEVVRLVYKIIND